jgi:tRNA 2-thiouridine synthesizing protein A
MTRRWDAGELGCSRLIFELKAQLERIPKGECLEVVVRDPGAQTDIPAWCRMTGHALESSDHPVYLIRRRRG